MGKSVPDRARRRARKRESRTNAPAFCFFEKNLVCAYQARATSATYTRAERGEFLRKNIYIEDSDLPLFGWAEKEAGDSLVNILTEALKLYKRERRQT
jgi:hypothetical protein